MNDQKYRDYVNKIIEDDIDPLEAVNTLSDMLDADVYEIRVTEFTEFLRELLDGKPYAEQTEFELQELMGHAYAEYWRMFGEEGSESHAKQFFMDCKERLGV